MIVDKKFDSKKNDQKFSQSSFRLVRYAFNCFPSLRTTRELLSGKRHLDCESRQPRKGNVKKKKKEKKNIYPAANMNYEKRVF